MSQERGTRRLFNTIMTIVLAFSLLLNGIFLFQSYQRNIVISVPDGDSLQMADGRRVRLLGVNAPERGLCMADEARGALATAAKGRHVRLKDVVTDDYGRQLAHVFINGTNINEGMVSQGLARSSSGFTAAQSVAKEERLGIWSDACRTSTNPDCDIKGNIRAGKKTYLLSDCANYNQTIIDTSYGDRWFCTEEEAVKAGFSKASGCSR